MSSDNNQTIPNSGEKMSKILSSLGCSWNASDVRGEQQEQAVVPKLPQCALEVTYPSFSLSHGELDEADTAATSTSAVHRETVQSKASELMSRTIVWKNTANNKRHKHQPVQRSYQDNQLPNRVMLESILDSFDQLVEARIRAYARILSNHVRVLSQCHNQKGARIAEYKLQTLLEIASNFTFDSVSTVFRETTRTKQTATPAVESKGVLPIELSVEIKSPRFYQGGSSTAVASNETGTQSNGTLMFRVEGTVRANGILVQHHNDATKSICSSPTSYGNSRYAGQVTSECQKASNLESCPGAFRCFETVSVEINCETLLSQMMNEASKVVTMAVELTNLAWKNNTQKQEEFSNLYDDNAMNQHDDFRNTANLIVPDDTDEDCNSTGAVQDAPQACTGKRSFCELRNDAHPAPPVDRLRSADEQEGTSSRLSKQVSEISFRPPAIVEVCHEEQQQQQEHSSKQGVLSPLRDEIPSPPPVVAVAGVLGTTVTITANDGHSNAAHATAAITNLEMVDQDLNKVVSVDPSFESASAASEERRRSLKERKGDDYSRMAAERASSIVDFALAGDMSPACFSSNYKRLRTE